MSYTHLERCGDDGLRRHDSRQYRYNESRDSHTRRNRIKQRICVRRWIDAQVRCLAYVRQEQTRIGPAKPADLDSPHAESTQVCKQSLDAGERKQDASQRAPRVSLIPDEVRKREIRGECFQDGMVELGEVVDAEGSDESEPYDNYRRKGGAELLDSKRLNHVQEDQNAASRSDDRAVGDVGNNDIQTLDGAEDRLRGR